VGAEASPPINLLPTDVAASRKRRALGMRVAAAAVAALVASGAGMAVVDRLAAKAELQSADLRRELSHLEPQLENMDRARQEATASAARRQALNAWAVQGPRLARVLEAIGANAPEQVAIHVLALESAGAAWRLELRGESLARDPFQAQASFNRFLRGVSASPYLGDPVRSPILRIVSNGPSQAGTAVTGASTVLAGAGGRSGPSRLEFTIEFLVPR
jgi:Tfp pilus assembly protein PilN